MARWGLRKPYILSFNHLLVLQGLLEETQEGSQAEAVHGVDFRQVRDDKIHLAGALSQRQVGIALLGGRSKRYT